MNPPRRHLPLCIAVLGALAVTGCNNTRLEFQRAAAELPKIKAEIQAAGISLDLKDLKPNIRPEEDAYPLLEPVIKQTELFKEAKKAVKNQPNLADGQFLQTMKAQLPKLDKMLDQLVLATKRPSVDFRIDWDNPNPVAIDFTETTALKEATPWLCYRGIALAENGDYERALRDFRAARQLARYLGSVPILIHHMVSLALETTLTRALKAAAHWSRYNPGFLRDLNAILVDMQSEAHPGPRIVRGEMAYSSACFRNPKLFQSPEMADLYELDPKEWTEDPVKVDAFHASILSGSFAVLKIMESKRSHKEIILELRTEFERRTSKSNPVNALNRDLLLSYDNTYGLWIRRQSTIVLTQAAIELSQRWAKLGRSPRGVEHLGDKFVDSYTSKPVLMVERQGKVYIYFPGMDFKDDGGVVWVDDVEEVLPPLQPKQAPLGQKTS